ncbi:AAA family ATPase [Actinoplanes sp. NPDC049548]|uniref:AAA family ATPase n=1 Tax=Actinoplanes sp. NPDC049548 TaxID=3155152 RepID=UPI003436110D
MLTVMLGGAPGVGKSTVAERLLELAQDGQHLVQWVDVDSLWLHQPWRVDDRMKAMVQANLRAVASHASEAEVDILLITWVFQSSEFHHLITGLLPAGTATMSVQLRAGEDTWVRRFEADPRRPGLNDFYWSRFAAAQATATDYTIETDGVTPTEVALRLAALVGLAEPDIPVAAQSSAEPSQNA